MKTIWKAALATVSVQEIEVPAGSRLLCAKEQYDRVCVWFMCDQDPGIAKVKRTILLVATGGDAPAEGEATYLGTALLDGGRFVLHVFEKI